jgi:hypothetical protein
LIQFSKKELTEVEVGPLSLFLEDGSSIEGEITKLNKNQAVMQVDFGFESLSKDTKLSLTKKKAPRGERSSKREEAANPSPPIEVKPSTFAGNFLFGDNPAIDIRVDNMRGQLGYGFTKVDGTGKSTSATYKVDSSQNNYGFEFIGRIPNMNLRLGVGYDVLDVDTKSKIKATVGTISFDSTSKYKSSEKTLAVKVVHPLPKNFAVGATLSQISYEEKVSGVSGSETYNTFSPGLLYIQKNYEVGLYWTPTINFAETGVSDSTEGHTSIHLDYRDKNYTYGALLRYERNSEVDSDEYNNTFNPQLYFLVNTPNLSYYGIGLTYEPDHLKHGDATTIAVLLLSQFYLDQSKYLKAEIGYANGTSKNDETDTTSSSKTNASAIAAKLLFMYLL